RCPRHQSTSSGDLLLLAILPVRFPELNAAALLHVIAGVHRQFAHDIAADDRLASEPRLRCEAPRRIEAVGLVILHLAQMLFAFADDDVAGRAGAAAAAGVLEWDVEVLRDIEERLGLSVVRIRQLT